MSDEDEELGPLEVYDPEPVSLGDGEMLILDPLLFAEQHNTNCVRMTGSQVWVLDNDTRKWRDIELQKPKRGQLAALPKKPRQPPDVQPPDAG